MCLCGDKLNNGAVLPTSMCSYKCSDNSTSYTCGGPGNGELYNTSVVASQLNDVNAQRPSGWLGCFANPANNVTADMTVSEGKLSATRCLAACAELGYGWAGITNRERESVVPLDIALFVQTLNPQNVDAQRPIRGTTRNALRRTTFVLSHVMAMGARPAGVGDTSICTTMP